MKYMEVLKRSSEIGMKVDREKLETTLQSINSAVDELQKDIPFSPTSNKDIASFIEKAGISLGKSGKRGPSVAKEVILGVIERLNQNTFGQSPAIPVLEKTLKAKSIIKTRGMAERLLEDIKFENNEWVVHTNFTDTCSSGRIYTEGPSLQLMPLECRECIVARQGYVFINADYSQEELRILATESGDEKLIKAIKDGVDLHTIVVWEMVPELNGQELTDSQRMLGKVLNYGIIYGMDANGVARELKVSQQEGQCQLDLYFEKFPGIQSWLRKNAEEIMKMGYSETKIRQRKCRIDYNSPDQEKELRRALNHIIQGTASDVLVKVVEEVPNRFPENPLRMVAHDAVLLEVPDQSIGFYEGHITAVMEEAGKPWGLTVECKKGKSWREAMGK